jgi:SAM-dependent methyltransferase
VTENWTSEKVGDLFSKNWWESVPNHLGDLLAKVIDDDYKLSPSSARSLSRSVLACRHVIDNVEKGGHVLDIACGVGQVSICLAEHGYDVAGFDASEAGIGKAREVAGTLGQNPSQFAVADQGYLKDLPDESCDAVIALGYFRYLDPVKHAEVYREIRRVMKPDAKFIVNYVNALFEIFSHNDGALKFWAETIREFSPAEELLAGKDTFAALKEIVQVPDRKFDTWSVSKTMPTWSANPLTYGDVASENGFEIERIAYPSPHLLPPNLERAVDPDALANMKHDLFLKRTEDWRSMFMEYEFLAFLTKA